MGSLDGSGNGHGQDKNGVTSIYDLSIREIEVCMRKLEADNVNLRRELYESRVKLNGKDEEILKIGRELLSHKTETLIMTRRIVALAEDFKKGQVDGLHNFLMNVFKSNEIDPQRTRSSVQCTSKPEPGSSFVPHPPQTQLAIVGPKSLEPSKTINPIKSTCSEDDDEQHVKSPFGYQYRHLRVQLHVDVDTTSPEEDMDDEEEYYPFDKNEEVEEKPGYNTCNYDRVN